MILLRVNIGTEKCLSSDDTVLTGKKNKDLQKLVKDFNTGCKGRRLTMKRSKRKVLSFLPQLLTSYERRLPH